MYLKLIRQKYNIKQQEIADLLEVTASQISRFEKGLSYPNSVQIIKLCKYLNCSADELLGLKSFEEQADEIIKYSNTTLSKEEIIKTKQVLEASAKYIESLIMGEDEIKEEREKEKDD